MKLNDFLKLYSISKKQASIHLKIDYCQFLKICNGQIFPTSRKMVQIWNYTNGYVGLSDWNIQLKESNKRRKCKNKKMLNFLDELAVESLKKT